MSQEPKPHGFMIDKIENGWTVKIYPGSRVYYCRTYTDVLDLMREIGQKMGPGEH